VSVEAGRSLNSLELDVLQKLKIPEAQARAFDVEFFPWREEDRRRVVLIRHRNPGEPEGDDFTCHDAETGENLGWGADKDDAVSAARYRLMCRAEGRE
jgi:hypothetical protein